MAPLLETIGLLFIHMQVY